jgi:hypothetical protein
MEINWLATALALVAGMVVAGVWYGKVFLVVWQKLTGIPPEDSKKASRKNTLQLLVANVTAVGLSAGVAIASAAFDNDSVWLALLVGLVAWLTFSASTLLQHNAFELKPPKLTLVNCSYQLVLFLAMALVIGLF